MSFQLSDLPGISDFTNLFDEYRLNSITVRFVPKFSGANTNDFYSSSASLVAPALPTLLTAIDPDGVFSTGTPEDMLQYGNVRWHKSSADHVIVKFKPTAFSGLQTNPVGGITANVQKINNSWISLDGSGTAVDFFGLAVLVKSPYNDLAGGTSSYHYSWETYVTYDISLRRAS